MLLPEISWSRLVRGRKGTDVRNKGKDFRAGELVWVYTLKRKIGRCPKPDSQVGPCRVLHRDRVGPCRGEGVPLFEHGVLFLVALHCLTVLCLLQ